MIVLITGITGFVGSHLADYLLEDNRAEVHGLTRWRSPKENILHCLDQIHLHHGDLLDFSSLLSVLEDVRPDIVFHLAAQSYVPYSFKSPSSTLDTNVIGTCNLLEAVKILKLRDVVDPVIHVCASSEVYGQVNKEDIPITEDCPFRPASPYAVSKVGEDMLGLQYWISYGIKTIRTRMFTHSIAYDSPVIIRSNELINIVPISDLRKAREKSRVECWDLNGEIEVWDGQKFSKVLNVSAHKLNGHKLLKFVTGSSIVSVTDNHSVYNGNDELVVAGSLNVGDSLAIRDLPDCKFEASSISTEFAWLLGFLVAEGTIKRGQSIYFSNKEIPLLKDTQSKVKIAWNKDCYLRQDGEEKYSLGVANASELGAIFDGHKSIFGVYTRCVNRATGKRYKKIPQIILNSSISIQSAFLEGYNVGDGRKNANLKSKYQEFKTNSPCLAAGLVFLIRRVTGQVHTLNCESRVLKNGKVAYYYSINLRSNSGHPRMNTGQHLQAERDQIKKIFVVSEDKKEFVYDLETDSHFFSAGIGSVKVHNTGRRRGDPFVLSNFAKQVAEIEAGKRDPIVKVGNLNSVRTFADVKDAVRAYWLLVNKCPPGEVYNIGGNETMTIGEMLSKLLKLSSVDNIETQVDASRLRPSDVTLQIPCIDKFQRATGWKAIIPFSQTLQDTLDYWRGWLNEP